MGTTDSLLKTGRDLAEEHLRCGDFRDYLETLAAQAEGSIALLGTHEARQQAERQLRLAMEGAEIGFWVADFNSGNFDASDIARTLHGIAKDLPMTVMSAMESIHPEDRGKVEAALRGSIEHGEPFSSEYRTWLPGCEGRWISSNARFFDDSGHRRLYGTVRDVTDRRKGEEELREARNLLELRVAERTAELEAANAALREQTTRLELALDASKGGVSIYEIGGEYLDWDNRMRELYGFDKDIPVSFGDLMLRIYPEDRKALLEDLATINAPGAGDNWNHEFRIAHPVLGERWIGRLGKVQRDARGLAVRVLGMSFDITGRKTTEESLRLSEEKYRTLHESMMDAFASIDINGRIIESNRAFQEMLGYTHEELCQLSYLDITPERWHAMEAEIAADERFHARGYTDLYEKEYRRKDGSVFPVELRAFLLRHTALEPARICAIIRDITDRKNAEQTLLDWNQALERRVAQRTAELNRTEFRFRQLAEATFEGIAISEDGILIDGNPRLAAINGYEIHEMIGRPILDFVAPESRDFVRARIADPAETNYEFTGQRKDGTTYPAECHASMRTWHGKTTRVSAVRDLTSVKRAAARLQAQQIELAHAQRLALVSEVSAGIVHQIGQPLSAMGANIAAALAGPDADGKPPCPHPELLADLQADVERMRHTVTRLRALADPEKPARTAICLNKMVDSVLPLLFDEAHHANVNLVFEPDAGLPPVLADPVQFSQVVLNLARNAFEACADRERGERFVRITTRMTGETNVELRVIDSGGGIPDEMIDHMFAPFVTTKPDGLGMGLRLSRTIVQAHGGEINGCNRGNAPGAVFRVLLPTCSADDYPKV